MAYNLYRSDVEWINGHKELFDWITDGLQFEQDEHFKLPEDQVPEDGTPVMGYRVMLRYTMPEDAVVQTMPKWDGTGPVPMPIKVPIGGKTVYSNILTGDTAGVTGGGGLWEKAALNNTPEKEISGTWNADVPIHHDFKADISAYGEGGFYYFPDKGMAEEYMQMMTLGKVTAFGQVTPIQAQEDNPIDIVLMRVSGTSINAHGTNDPAFRTEGLTMQDVHIDEIEKVIPLKDIGKAAEYMKNLSQDQETLDRYLGPDDKRRDLWKQVGDWRAGYKRW